MRKRPYNSKRIGKTFHEAKKNVSVKFNELPLLKKILRPLILFLLFVLVYMILRIYVYRPSPNQISYVNNNFNVLGLNIPSDLDFCGEKIPSNDYEIKKDLDREFFSNSYW